VVIVDAGRDAAPYEPLITESVLAALESLGAPTQRTTAVEALEMRTGANRDPVLYEHGMATGDRRTLRDILCRSAVDGTRAAPEGRPPRRRGRPVGRSADPRWPPGTS
jgi:hypothetical protein